MIEQTHNQRVKNICYYYNMNDYLFHFDFAVWNLGFQV